MHPPAAGGSSYLITHSSNRHRTPPCAIFSAALSRSADLACGLDVRIE